jgi:hypothetical protein
VTTANATSPLSRVSRPDLAVGAVGLLVGLVIVFLGNYHVDKGENGGTGPGIVTAIICVVLAAVLFGYVVPRAQNLERTTIILSALAIVSIVAFWSGVTPILAAAALVLLRRGAVGSNAARILTVLAVVAAVASLVVTIVQSD